MSGALWIARAVPRRDDRLPCGAVASFGLGWLSWRGIGAIVVLLLYEHRLVKADDLSRVDAAFFTVNGYVSVLFFLFWAADMYFFGLAGVRLMQIHIEDRRLQPILEKVEAASA